MGLYMSYVYSVLSVNITNLISSFISLYTYVASEGEEDKTLYVSSPSTSRGLYFWGKGPIQGCQSEKKN